ncbi:MAG TPA: DEAD/DEAH box helicase [Edaphocola sp.]|nr:DEAD/DEAH box helicase [Edaphocola sp.]
MDTTFQEFDLQDNILKAIKELGFEKPSPIQQQAIPMLLQEDSDIIALAQTGTGKTAAFGLPVLQKLDFSQSATQALILSPTRELCIQTQEEIEKYGKFISGLNTLAVYGGAPISGQIRALKTHPKILVATPGRLIDLLNRGIADLSNVRIVVLDEADEMLNMGFRDDIDFILGNSVNRTCTWLFSATMNPDVRRISKRYMKAPKEIAVARENAGNEHIDHQYYVINAHQRYDALCRLIDFTPDIYGIIFTRTKLDAQDISEKLARRGVSIGALHGDMDQKARTRVMDKFKKGYFQIIVATDVAARGIDVNDITHVINYELPDDPEVYTHRSGRTARAGKSGICISLVTSREIHRIRMVERLSKTKFHKSDLPDGSAVIRKRLNHFFSEMAAAAPSDTFLENTQRAILEKMAENAPELLIQKMLWLQFKDLIKEYDKAKDLNAGYQQSPENRHERGRTVRLFVNLGSKDGLHAEKLVHYIADTTDLDKKLISRVTVRELSSFFNVPTEALSFLEHAFAGVKYNGRRVRIEDADATPGFKGGKGKFADAPNGGGFSRKGSREGYSQQKFSRNKNPKK